VKGSVELLASCFTSLTPDVRELRVWADAAFGYHPVPDMLGARPAQYAVVARMTTGLKRKLGGLRYERGNPRWEIEVTFGIPVALVLLWLWQALGNRRHNESDPPTVCSSHSRTHGIK
jgi:hypothetical protein